MQKILGYARRAVADYKMINHGDKIAVGLSGGKDSAVLLNALAGLRRFLGIEFELVALTIDMGFPGQKADWSGLTEHCGGLGIQHLVKETNIAEIVFDIRKEKNPCSLCAKMRRGSLHDFAKEQGCGKIALGHHFDDAAETFMMNLFNEGRIGCFSPVTYLSRKDITVIRPLIYTPESEIRRAVKKLELPVMGSVCPADGCTSRQKMKEFLRELEAGDKGLKERVFGAMKRGHVSGW